MLRRFRKRLAAWVLSARVKTHALFLAARDPRVPRAAKVLAALVAAYALSPIDLIPDFIPGLGLLDDLILVPLGCALAVRLIPDLVWQECLATARRGLDARLPRSRAAAAGIVVAWVVAAGLLGLLTFHSLRH
jgi:uncharacterized membrane protein YkvA (DUF1232 family)